MTHRTEMLMWTALSVLFVSVSAWRLSVNPTPIWWLCLAVWSYNGGKAWGMRND